MDAAAKQQIVERVKQATNILVTVSSSPSVDQLAACIGLTLLLNKMEKHATAVFSGKVPSTIEFLQPEKTLETNTDSLRDFIISLDKNKADKLRYKVEDQVVRIFITPYRTSLSEKDLVFSQGDLNVEVVIALGVQDRRQIDAAITAHGRILHDATVISLNTGPGNAPQLGQINWQDSTASSLSEMLVSISEAFAPGLIDNQIATAFLTGIVAQTDRFSNAKTSPKVMTISAQLMAAGANQQLIASKLEPPEPIPLKSAIVASTPVPATPPPRATPPPPAKPATTPTPHKPVVVKPPEKPKEKGALNVSHDKRKPDSPEVEIIPGEIHIDEKGNLQTTDELRAEIARLKKLQVQQPPAPEPLPPIEPTLPIAPPAPEPLPAIVSHIEPLMTPPLPQPDIAAKPAATAPQEPPKPHELMDPKEKPPSYGAPAADASQAEWVDPYDSASIDSTTSMGDTFPAPHKGALTPTHEKVVQPPPEPVLPPLILNPEDSLPASIPALDNARSAVESAISAAPYDTAYQPAIAALNAQPVDLGLHSPVAEPPPVPKPLARNSNPTPSFQLPTTESPAPAPAAPDMTPPAPPLVPPPLTPAPGVVIPNNPIPPAPLF